MKSILLLITLVLGGCSGNNLTHSQMWVAKWVEHPTKDTIYCYDADFVRDSDSRVMATITQYAEEDLYSRTCESCYKVWHNGAGYGDFVALAPAKKHAEDIARKLEEKTTEPHVEQR